jgi:hypothetical protein
LFARSLGFRYLWNDALCIVRDDTLEQKIISYVKEVRTERESPGLSTDDLKDHPDRLVFFDHLSGHPKTRPKGRIFELWYLHHNAMQLYEIFVCIRD